ncbi:hypothetical protein Tco_1338647 [Tanacetum coccineum]
MDVSELDNVKYIITLALRLAVFIYNHNWPLSWLRKRPGWAEIIRPAATGFGNAFIALKSLVDHKNDLQSLVISSEFRKMLKLKNAVDCKQVVMNENFWNKRLIIVRVMTPLLRILRLCDSDDRTLRTSIHCAANWLNSAFQYDRKNFCKKHEASRGILDTVDKRSYDLIDYECIDDMDFWVVEEEPQQELDYDQLETMLDEQDEERLRITRRHKCYTLVGEDEHDSEFRLLSDSELDAYNIPMSQ